MFLDNKTRSTISTGLLIGYVAWDLAAPYFFGKEDTPPESNKDKNPAVRTMQGDVGYITQGLGISSEKGLRLLDDLKAADTDPQKMTDIWNAYQAGKYGEITSDAFVRDLGDRSIYSKGDLQRFRELREFMSRFLSHKRKWYRIIDTVALVSLNKCHRILRLNYCNQGNSSVNCPNQRIKRHIRRHKQNPTLRLHAQPTESPQ